MTTGGAHHPIGFMNLAAPRQSVPAANLCRRVDGLDIRAGRALVSDSALCFVLVHSIAQWKLFEA